MRFSFKGPKGLKTLQEPFASADWKTKNAEHVMNKLTMLI